jgi:hypothetical protein
MMRASNPSEDSVAPATSREVGWAAWAAIAESHSPTIQPYSLGIATSDPEIICCRHGHRATRLIATA